MLLMAEDPERRGLVGRGLADATRHAAFAPEVMAAVVAKNPEAPAAARDLARILVELADLAERDADALAARAAEARALRKELGL
jgi:prephenate dehydrogenase